MHLDICVFRGKFIGKMAVKNGYIQFSEIYTIPKENKNVIQTNLQQ